MFESDVWYANGGQHVKITLSVWVNRDEVAYFAASGFDFSLSEGELVSYRTLVVEPFPRGVVFEPPATLRNFDLGQLHLPSHGIHADERNPLPILEVSWFTEDLAPRRLGIILPEVRKFRIYPDAASSLWIDLEPGEFPKSIVFDIPIGTPCRADIDGDGELTIFDFLAFQNLFAQGDLAADFDGDGELTIFDFLAFQNEFALGCD